MNLGDVIAGEDHETAIRHWREAGEIFDELGADEAAEARHRLIAGGNPDPARGACG